MRIIFIFCMALGVACFLAAQTNTPSEISESPALAGAAGVGQTEIRSEKGGEFYLKLKTYIYRSNVRVDNSQMKLACELLTIESPELKEGKFNRATAETNVVINWLDENGTNHATADRAVYTYAITNLATPPEHRWQTNSLVVLSGNPFVTDGRGNTYKWDPIIWDRMNGVISTTNMLEMKITNAPGAFDNTMPKAKPAAK